MMERGTEMPTTLASRAYHCASHADEHPTGDQNRMLINLDQNNNDQLLLLIYDIIIVRTRRRLQAYKDHPFWFRNPSCTPPALHPPSRFAFANPFPIATHTSGACSTHQPIPPSSNHPTRPPLPFPDPFCNSCTWCLPEIA